MYFRCPNEVCGKLLVVETDVLEREQERGERVTCSSCGLSYPAADWLANPWPPKPIEEAAVAEEPVEIAAPQKARGRGR